MKFSKCIITVLFFIFICTNVFANPIVKAIDNTNLKRNSIISVSVRETNSAKDIYSLRSGTYLNPASSLKVFTMAAALDTLGEKYNFETIVYIDNKDLYLKLGADPLLTHSDLKILAQKIKAAYGGHIRNFYIDDSIIDKKYYPDGWTVDDFWPNSPKISPYIVDNNTVSVDFLIEQNKAGKSNVKIIQNDDYKFSFINELEISDKNNIISSLNYGESSGIVSLRGTLAKNLTKQYPVLDTAQFFAFRLRKALDSAGVSYSKPFYPKKVPANAKRIASFARPIGDVLSFILKTSDNFAAEVVFKAAGAKWTAENNEYIKNLGGSNSKNQNTKNSFENAKTMFFDFYDRAGLNNNKINLSDASGVSRYNTMTTSWMSEALVYLDKNSKIKDYMASPGEGTLTRRMRDLKDNLKAKTGTIFGVSSLCGYLTSANDVQYVFSIIIQNFSERPSVIKGLEDDIVSGIYFIE